MTDSVTPTKEELQKIASEGILRLLAVRFYRHLDHKDWVEKNPDKIAKDCTDDMEDWKLVRRILRPDIKKHQLYRDAPRDAKVRVENPYYHPAMTKEIIEDAISQLKAEIKLVHRMPSVTTSVHGDAPDAPSNRPHAHSHLKGLSCRITDPGITAAGKIDEKTLPMKRPFSQQESLSRFLLFIQKGTSRASPGK